MDYHVFRVEKDDTNVKLFVDNEADASITIALGSLPQNNLADETQLLETSGDGKSAFNLLFFRFRIASTNFNTVGPSGCAGDFDDDDDVDTDDLLTLFAAWGPCVSCDEDLNSDDDVNTEDLLILFANWGDCP